VLAVADVAALQPELMHPAQGASPQRPFLVLHRAVEWVIFQPISIT